jgi:thymidylate synthase ThyX
MHLIELRSGREGHPTYRAVAQAMHERIASVHPAIAAAMTHVDSTSEPRLERIMSEIRTHRKQAESESEPEASDAPPGVSALG